jgi:Tol biopolymer transport system component
MWVSPDGTWVAFDATYQATVNEPYVAKLDNSDAHRLVHYTVTNTRSRQLQWTADGTAIYGAGNFDAANSRDLYRLDPSMTDQTPTKAVDSPTNGSVGNVLIRTK